MLSFLILLFYFLLDIIYILRSQKNLRNRTYRRVVLVFLSTMAAFTCTSSPPICLRSEMRIASSKKVSLSTRHMFSVLPESGGLRTRVSLSSSVSKNSRLRQRGGIIICEAQEATTGSMLLSLFCWINAFIFWLKIRVDLLNLVIRLIQGIE